MLPESKLVQKIEFVSFAGSSLEELLNLPEPVFKKDDPYRQLRYLDDYLRQPEIGCESILVEDHYIDRDYMEDHSVFYSKSLVGLSNHCRRLHFFKGKPDHIQQEIARIHKISTKVEFKEASHIFSQRAYLGFSVIKPLNGCPVGRTVVRTFPETTEFSIRVFNCACRYHVHLLGLPLSVKGLAFQQQDLGVSACATTALWSALQRTRELEEGMAATPAQITMRASQSNLPFGRPMPSEGLSVGQMCQAVYSFGYSPNLIRASDFHTSRAVLYSAVLSGLSPVLIIKSPSLGAHAVAVSGMKLRLAHEVSPIQGYDGGFDDAAGDLLAAYIHDDRFGPYLRASIRQHDSDLYVEIELKKRGPELWTLSHILIPMHNKVRLSFPELRELTLKMLGKFSSALNKTPKPSVVSFRIVKSHSYIESQIINENPLTYSAIEFLTRSIPFPRYVGVASVESNWLGVLDLLIDTTSTERNIHYLALVHKPGTDKTGMEIAKYLSTEYSCPFVS